MDVFYEGLLVKSIITNQSLTIDQAIRLIDIDSFCKEYQLDKSELNYNDFKLVYY